MGKHLLSLIRFCTFLDISIGTEVCSWGGWDCIIYLLFFSTDHVYENTREIKQWIPKMRICFLWHNHTQVRVLSRPSPSRRGARRTDDRKQMARGRRRRVRPPWLCSKYPSLLCGFPQSRFFQKNSNGDFLCVKTLTNSCSSHLLLYSFLPRCYCEKLAVKFNWFKIFRIHMAANPGAEAAIAPHCCSQAFASPLVPRWWE